ncbi:hypothetical protein ACFE04_024483 [Oxalis oulophora]
MKEQGYEIKALNINYSIFTNKTNPFNNFLLFANRKVYTPQQARTRHILKDVSFTAKPWEVLAIVGPSGAGKSSLLDILSGKLTPQSGTISVNQKPIDKYSFRKISGYVTQKDTLFPLLTVQETLIYSAKLRLQDPEDQLKARVKSLIQELGLDHVSSTRVGDDERVRGISGGERRRVSIGVDLIHDPKVLILDEPTSGLDSNYALQIIGLLKEMAEKKGRTIILSIHQPGFRILKAMNSILLLADGSVLHNGTLDQLNLNLSLMGLQIPMNVNVVEFAIDSIETIQQQRKPTEFETTRSKFTLEQLFQQSNVVDEEIFYFRRDFANSRLRETMILTHRFSKTIFRTKELFACRTIQMVISGLVLGSVFYKLKVDLTGAEERVGLFAFTLTFLLSCTTEGLPIFLQEKEILMKETSSASYRISSYAIANGLVYLPFLLILAILFSVPLYWLAGLNPNLTAFTHFVLLIWLVLYTANSVVVCFSALVPDFIMGNSVISGVMGSFFLFSGYFISKNGIPSYWILMHYVSLFKYPFEGLLINEFSDSDKCWQFVFGKCMVSGEDVLKEEGYKEGDRWRNVVIMVCFILLYRFSSYIILRCKCSQRSSSGD